MKKKNKIILSVIALTFVLLLAIFFLPQNFKKIANLDHTNSDIYFSEKLFVKDGLASQNYRLDKNRAELVKIMNDYTFVRSFGAYDRTTDAFEIVDFSIGKGLIIDANSKLFMGNQTFQAIKKEGKPLFEELMKLHPFE